MIRWKCTTCGKKWIYPIDKCLYCMDKGVIEKEVSTKFKVIGCSKVSIPSPLHPVIPYYSLMLEDENGNKMPKKSMKEYKIGDNYEFAKGDVALVKQKYDIYEAVKLALQCIGDIDVNTESKVLIKPSIIAPMNAYLGVTTNPKVLDGIIQLLAEKGVKRENISVGEQTPFMPIEVSAKKSSIASICKKHGVSLIDLSKQGFSEKEGYEISNALDVDLIINVPAMKMDSRFGISGALENMTRVLSTKSQAKLFNEDISKGISKFQPKQVIIGDAILSMDGNGPMLGEPAHLNLILAGKDPVAVDELYCKIIMVDTPDYVKNSVGNHNPKIGGEELAATRYPIKGPQKGATPNPDIFVVGKSPCPLCYFGVMGVLSKLMTTRGEKTYLAIGAHFDSSEIEGKERLVAIGDEAISALTQMGIEPSAKIEGCPPDMAEMLIFIKKIFTSDLKKAKIGMVDKIKAKVVKKVMELKK